VITSGGAGYSTGITLTVPTIFNVNAQSLVFSFAQRNYIRAAHSDLQAASLALADAKDQVAEDTAVTYLSISHTEETAAVLQQE
jgi:outer membrane protein TolC